MISVLKKICIMISFIIIYVPISYSLEVAITVDDLPYNGDLPPNKTRVDIAKKMLAIFKKHDINHVYGFINAKKLEEDQINLYILQEWIKQGQLLGNHTYSHVDLVEITTDEFITNVQMNEPILQSLMQNKNYHYFRYPFLAEGNTQEKRDAIRQFLFQNQYKIAEVTTDFFEYEWNNPYVRCLKKNDWQSIAWLKKNYLEQAKNALIISHELSMMLFHRDIKNILLIHINALTTDMLDDLLTAYEKQGVQFIPLNEALTDDVYKVDPQIVNDRTYTFLNQIRISRGLKNPDIINQIYDSFPEKELEQLCR